MFAHYEQASGASIAASGDVLLRFPRRAAAPPTPQPAPRVSVIIPVRNDPDRLKRCLDAITASSYRDFEIIVADDDSTDETPEIAESACARVVRMERNVGSAAARNAAVEQAVGEIVLFVDADVLVHPNTLEVAVRSLDDNPSFAAVFGSYDLDPGERSLLSQYKNLAHRYYHQTAKLRASTFWTGCGAIRRDAFRSVGGFDANLFGRPSIEDIELGVRLTRAGRKILVNRRMQAKHLKRWGLRTIFKSDVFDRAIPWTQLILQMQEMPHDLNVSMSQRISAVLAGLFVALFAAACWSNPSLIALPFLVYGTIVMADRYTGDRRVSWTLRMALGFATLMVAVAAGLHAGWWSVAMSVPLGWLMGINAGFYWFFLRHRGLLFTTAVLPMHVLYYVYSSMVFTWGTLAHRVKPSPALSPTAAVPPLSRS